MLWELCQGVPQSTQQLLHLLLPVLVVTWPCVAEDAPGMWSQRPRQRGELGLWAGSRVLQLSCPAP